VVGPNGCGKSNIIDAVRWVMGESSASRLRGDALTDVIFSGSSARKPVSQATVELIFDNSDRAISGDASTGQYAAFNEISVKRTVGRDSLSLYSLNGSKCRRRDITDLFLGTGLGPRSYSIIEQGMISQIIEARPEDLRVYLEEAAGISKYKERRRETETRIRHTRENLDRLNDLRDEVGKQLEHLRRQARQAEQYQALQADRRLRDAEWNALQFRALDGELQALRTGLSMEETRLQQLIAQQREAERELETGRARRDLAAETLNQAQAASYEIGGQLARIEQQIAHQRDLGERLQRARDEAESTLGELRGHIGGDQGRLDELRAAMEQAEPQLQYLQSDDATRQQALREAEEQLADWQRRWDAHAAQANAAARAADVERTRLDHLEQQGLEAQRREQALAAERAGLDPDALTSALQALHGRHDLERQSLDQLGTDVETRRSALEALEESQRGLQAQLSEVRERLQAARGRLSSLETLQHAALGQEQGEASDWLRAQSLQDAPRLGATLQVEEGFETATEAALGALLEAVLVEKPADWITTASTLREGRLGLVAASADSGDADIAPTALAARVNGPASIRRLLAHWHVADDLEH
ncbi:MAG TPA: chromosome segregation protein SMC, partial [Xanthomonadaceae bacterium]|nr:chromosome segregation protein SMC [Xanthomonadaceae bacterium]